MPSHLYSPATYRARAVPSLLRGAPGRRDPAPRFRSIPAHENDSAMPLSDRHDCALAEAALDVHLVHQAARARQAEAQTTARGEAFAHYLLDVVNAGTVILD